MKSLLWFFLKLRLPWHKNRSCLLRHIDFKFYFPIFDVIQYLKALEFNLKFMTSQTRILLNYWTFLTENEKLTSFSLSLQKPKLIISVAQTELYYFVNTYREKKTSTFLTKNHQNCKIGINWTDHDCYCYSNNMESK